MSALSVSEKINELTRVNQRIVNYADPAGFRTVDVVCQARTGQTIRFASPEAIPTQLVGLLTKFENLIGRESTLENLSQAFSLFWLGFIAIHPFYNGNGRTGKVYLMHKAQEMGFVLRKPDTLDAILLQGDVQRDLSLLQIYFMSNLTPKDKK